jgi:hypothetical protein
VCTISLIPHIPPHLPKLLLVAKEVHFPHSSFTDLVGRMNSGLLGEERVLTEVFREQVEKCLSMGSWAKYILQVMGPDFIVLEHPIRSVLLVLLLIFISSQEVPHI